MNNKVIETYLEEFKKHHRYNPTILGKIKRIENHITNLQESEAYYYGQYKDYKSRNEKAIEYIKNKQELNKMFGTITLSKDSQKELLNILGSDDNE